MSGLSKTGDVPRKRAYPFEDWLLALKAHMETHGGRFPTDRQKTPLSRWVSKQRALKRKLDRDETSGAMCFQRVSKLNELGNFFLQ